MFYGPAEYIPPVQVEIVETRKSIPLDENEGVYIQDKTTGQVTLYKGPQTYYLQANEHKWDKVMTDEQEELVATDGFVQSETDENGKTIYKKPNIKARADKSRVIKFKVPHNSVVQLFNYKTSKMRHIFGPDMIMLEPYEEFTVLNLSGDAPKVEGLIRTLAMELGPTTMRDRVEVETSDHAKLYLPLSYSWYYKYDKEDSASVEKMFSIKDYTGTCCKSMASKIRGCASTIPF